MIIYELSRRLLSIVSRIGIDAEDTAEVRLHKTLLTAVSLFVAIAAYLWATIYFLFDEPEAAAIPFSYAVISSISIYMFHRTHEYRFFRFSQLFLILVLPFLLMVALGGFINSSAVILWALLSPFGALFFADLRQSLYWFGAYLGLIIISGFLQTLARPVNNLPPELIILFFVLNIGTISTCAFVLLYYFIAQKERTYTLLQVEQAKSERLLLNVLPKEIAAILKDEQQTIAEYFESASVLFVDLVGFTTLSMQMSPVAMVELLNEIFSHLDSLVEKYNLEKIRTVGDGYMVAAGVPRRRPDHCQALALMALEMCDYMNGLPLYEGQRISFRFGMDTGPMIGGVIGQQKYHYDVWGDVVTTASRMESHGVAQKIQITRNVYEMLKDEFVCEPRGCIEVKGKGTMDAWFLTAALHEADGVVG